MSEKKLPLSRDQYHYSTEITTRWMDNDVYAHVNNVVYYSYFDTVVNQYLIENDVLDPVAGETIGLVVETQCNYFSPVSFPDRLTACLRVARLGNSSVRYEVGIFRNDEQSAAAQGHFVHVYVERDTRKSTALPEALRLTLEKIAN
jgi:acyl-CoA thioester hydrolase